MKVGLTVTSHRSPEIRPNGVELLNNFFESFRNSLFKYDYGIYISDNQSTLDIEYPKDLNVNVTYIENQNLTGLTGAWNTSIYNAYLDNCDFIWNFNDDIILNNSINKFIKVIHEMPERDTTFYGPLSDNGGSPSPNTSSGPSEGYTFLNIRPNSWDNLPNGFSFGFTRKFYETYRYKDNQFYPINHTLNGGDGKWGGQEGWISTLSSLGVKACLINECWIEHVKIRDYAKARSYYGE
jgi:GT2 family glycosyltransferase